MLQSVGLVKHFVSLSLLAVLVYGLSASVAVAERKNVGLSVQKDQNDNIHVVLDPALISKMQANRQNGRITMTLSKEHSDVIEIDRVLKDARVVDVITTPQGRQVTIHTDAVYWDVKPGDAEPVSKKLKKAEAKQAKAKKQQLKQQKQKKIQEDKLAHQPAIPMPDEAMRIPNALPKLKALKKKTVAKLVKHPAKPVPAKTIVSFQNKTKPATVSAHPLALPKLVEDKPRRSLFHLPGDGKARPETHATASIIRLPEPAQKAAAIPEPVSGLGGKTPSENLSDAGTPDEETALLNWDESKQPSASKGFDFSQLFRIVASLAVVLVLAVGFIKWMLPRMIANGFFQPKEEPVKLGRRISKQERLARRAEPVEPAIDPLSRLRTASSAPPQPQKPKYPTPMPPPSAKPYATPVPQGAWEPPSQRYAADDHTWESYQSSRQQRDKKASANPRQTAYPQPGAHAVPSPYSAPHAEMRQARPVAGYEVPEPEVQPSPLQKSHLELHHRQPLMHHSSQRAFIERLGEEEEGFQILNSTKIDKSKELHLIEIRGRQLVLATTPYSVNLVTELVGSSRIAPENSSDFLIETARKVQDSQDIYKKYLSSERAHTREQTYQELASQNRYMDPTDVIVLDDYDDVFKR